MTKRRLTEGDIVGIITLFIAGIKKYEIARRYGVDNATVHYQLNKNQILINRYKHRPHILMDEDFDSWFKRQHQAFCDHPSFRCGVCGVNQDHARSTEYLTIKSLRERVGYLESTLRINRVPF